MRPGSDISAGKGERGVVILLVAVVLLFIVGAMAALAIDVVTFYTARSEAQTAADAAALAGARVLANSGLTSTAAGPAAAETLATIMAKQVATRNEVGGRTLNPSTEVNVFFNDTDPTFKTNPRVTVQTSRADLPTFFARVWGNTAVRVQASATAEVYNPSGVNALDLEGENKVLPVAPTCVKPWLLPNISPNDPTQRIFNASTGAISDTGLLGWSTGTPQQRLRTACGAVCSPLPAPPGSGPTWVWSYYPADPGAANFPPPSAASVQCAGNPGFSAYQLSVAGCVQRPIVCNSTVGIDTLSYPNRDGETGDAVTCLSHSSANKGDSVDLASVPPLRPFQFLAGADSPVVEAGVIAAGTDVLVSDSLVTVPVVNIPPGATSVTTPVQVIGFAQLFLNPTGQKTPAGSGQIPATVINLAGCGTGASGQPILGNGASPVPVRLVSPQQNNQGGGG